MARHVRDRPRSYVRVQRVYENCLGSIKKLGVQSVCENCSGSTKKLSFPRVYVNGSLALIRCFLVTFSGEMEKGGEEEEGTNVL